jgi:glycerol-3-phosphate acyltransferase PlsY
VTALSVTLSYVLGSVPTGLWLGLRFKRVDIRDHGSKNIGATNTLRVLGKGLGVAALMADIGKGAAAVLLVSRPSAWEYAPMACGLAAIAGHNWSLFLKFKGGKGVATRAGVFGSLAPLSVSAGGSSVVSMLPIVVAFAVFVAIFALTRMVSAGSIMAAVALTVGVLILPFDTAFRVVTILVAGAVIVKHRSNIQRILTGTENRF